MDFYLLIDGKQVPWQSTNKVVFERFNPLFDFSTVQGSKVNDFVIPFSPVSDQLFNWYYLPQSQLSSVQYLCEKYAYGVLIECGFIYLVDVSEDGYIVAFTQNLSEFFGDYQRTTFNKLPLGTEAIPANFVANVDYLTAKYALPVIINSGFYGNESAPWYTGRMNDYSAGAYIADSTKVPMLFVRYLFERMQELCNFTVEGEFFTSELYKRMLMYNTFSLDDRTAIEYANHLPEEQTIVDFLLDLRKLFNVVFFFDVQARKLVGKFGKTLMNSETRLNFTGKVAPSKRRTPEKLNRLELDWERESNDDLMKVPPTDFEKYTTAPQEQGVVGQLFSLKTRISTLTKDTDTGLAIAKQAGVSTRLNQGSNTFKTRILFWNGMVNGLPTATNEMPGIRLAWHGNNNLVDNFWSEYESWRLTASMRPLSINLSALDLADTDFHRTSGANMAFHHKGRDYYIASIKTQLPLTEASEVEAWIR